MKETLAEKFCAKNDTSFLNKLSNQPSVKCLKLKHPDFLLFFFFLCADMPCYCFDTQTLYNLYNVVSGRSHDTFNVTASSLFVGPLSPDVILCD